MSTACCWAIFWYNWYIIIIAKRIAVPPTRAPRRSATEAQIPIAAPPIIVKGPTYLFRIDSNTLSSFLNPGILIPLDIIFPAWLLASIPDVVTQKYANKTEKMQEVELKLKNEENKLINANKIHYLNVEMLNNAKVKLNSNLRFILA